MLNLLFFNPYLSYRVAPLPATLPPPPEGTERFLIGPPNRQIEVLRASPSTNAESTSKGRKVFLLQHGGFGRAECYTHFLPALAKKGYTAYAISLRGHGWSWRPSYLRMLSTTQGTLAKEDLGQAVNYIRQLEGPDIEIIAVGHSAGGGLVQYATQHGVLGRVHKMVLLAAYPPFGGAGVFWNWYWLLDRWAFPRALLVHLMHPRSALSTPALLKGAFFSASYPMDLVIKLANSIPVVESLLWPFGMMYRFINSKNVLSNVEGGNQNVLVVAGSEDKLMRPVIMKRVAQEYNCMYKEVEGSGHHLMLDLFWEDAVEKVVDFVEQSAIP